MIPREREGGKGGSERESMVLTEGEEMMQRKDESGSHPMVLALSLFSS